VALSQVKTVSWGPHVQRNPQYSRPYAQARCRCAQVIHTLVHSQQVSSPLAALAGRCGSARQRLPDTTSTPDPRPGAGIRSRKNPGRGRSGARCFRLPRGRAGTSPVRSAVTWAIAAGIPAGGRRAGPGARRSRQAELGKAPPCMRWRGLPGLAAPGQSAAWPCWRCAPPPVPGTRARDRSPGSSLVPGVAPRWCPFPAVKTFLLPPRTPRKSLKPIHSGFSRYPHGIHRKNAVIRTRR
jgi:hypothetical protein